MRFTSQCDTRGCAGLDKAAQMGAGPPAPPCHHPHLPQLHGAEDVKKGVGKEAWLGQPEPKPYVLVGAPTGILTCQ